MEKETVWRLQEADIDAVMDELNIPKNQRVKILDYVKKHIGNTGLNEHAVEVLIELIEYAKKDIQD